MAIEDELAARFDAAHLAVYGDQLLEQGDPRGELIALDLGGLGADVIERKNQLLVEWIGAELVGEVLRHGAIECGFVELHTTDPALLARVLASPAAPFLRTLTLSAYAPTIAAMVGALVATPRPWLSALALQVTASSPAGPAIARRLAERIAPALPRLTSLEVSGHRVFGWLGISSLTHLEVSGDEAIASLSEPGEPLLPAVSRVDLAFAGGQRQREGSAVNLLPVGRFPALTHLDLSRCEPGTSPPDHLGGTIDPFSWLAAAAIRAQLVEVRIPSLRTERQAEALMRAIDGMPVLRRIEQVRRFAQRDARFATPPGVVREIPWPRPWLPADELADVSFAISLTPGEPPNVCSAQPLVHWLDAHARTLSDHVLTAWRHVFALIAQLEQGTEQPFPAVVLDTALAPLTDASGLSGWTRLRAQLRRPRVQLPLLQARIRRL